MTHKAPSRHISSAILLSADTRSRHLASLKRWQKLNTKEQKPTSVESAIPQNGFRWLWPMMSTKKPLALGTFGHWLFKRKGHNDPGLQALLFLVFLLPSAFVCSFTWGGTPQHIHRGQRTTRGSLLSPNKTWGPGMKHRSLACHSNFTTEASHPHPSLGI